MHFSIVALEKHKKKCETMQATLCDGQTVLLTLSDCMEMGLKKGSVLTAERLCALQESYQSRKSRTTAARVLAYRSYSKKGLEKRLRDKGIAPKNAADAADWLENLGFLSDPQYAKSLFEGLCRKGYGPRHIRYTLSQKGFEKDTIDALFIEETDYIPYIQDYLAKKGYVQGADRAARKKLADALFRRGHRYEDITQALRLYDDGFCTDTD